MKFYLIDKEEQKNKENKIFFCLYVLDLTNHAVSKIYVDEDIYNSLVLDEDFEFLDISDNIALRYDISNACYKLSYKR